MKISETMLPFKSRDFCGGAVQIAAATAENRTILVHSAHASSWQLLEAQWISESLAMAIAVLKTRLASKPGWTFIGLLVWQESADAFQF